MRVEELKVGDYVCYSTPNNYITRVDGIRQSSDGDETNYSIICDRDKKRDPKYNPKFWEHMSVDILHPIPLTKELLETLQFELQDGWYKRRFGEDVIAIHLQSETYRYVEIEYAKLCYNVDDPDETEYGCSMTYPEEAYLHELQQFMIACRIKTKLVL